MRVLFVCSANTCRSQMLEFMFADYVQKRAGLLDGLNIETTSAGVFAQGESTNSFVLEVLSEHGVPCRKKQAVRADKDVLESADIVFAMNQMQKELVENTVKNANVKSLSSICKKDIFDPYGQGKEAYENLYGIFEKSLKTILDIVVFAR